MEDLLIKAATVIAVGLATFSSFPGTAQQDPAAQAQTSTQQTPGSADAAKSRVRAALKPVSGELVDKLDSKSAKQGDNVVVRTNESLTTGGTEIPKGSKLIGHVTNVQARGNNKENSQIAIQFDRAELKGGEVVPIESVIQSVAPSGSDEVAGAAAGVAGSGGVAAGSATAPGMSSDAGSMRSAGNPADSRPGLGSSTTPQVGSMNQNTGAETPAPGSIVAQNGNVAIRATAIPGVLLANDIQGLPFSNASGMLLGAGRDVHLEGGSRVVLAVAMAPQAAGSGMTR